MNEAPILIASQLLELVKKTYGASTISSNPPLSPLEVFDSKYQIEDLCGQLLRTVLGPLAYTTLLAESCQESSALGFITTLGVPDLLGDTTMSLSEISDALGVNAKYLKVALNCLTRHGYFHEAVGPSGSLTYRNNELSSVLKETHPTSVKNAVGFICDEGFKATSHLLPASKNAAPGEKELVAVNLAFGFNGPLFDWMSQEAWRGKRMGNAMKQLHSVVNGNVITDYDWPALESPIIDIGGGIGSLELALAKECSESPFQFVIFDIPETIVWEEQPLSINFSVAFQAGNFMADNFDDTFLPTGMPTYLIRHVLHDWSDPQVLHILKHVYTAMSTRSAAHPKPKLILCEMLLRADSHRFIRTTSMQLLSLAGGLTRTELEMVLLLEKAGFSVVRSQRLRAADSIIEAIIP
ncbi:hypothetical protein AGABI2DRAFT_116080 [Agaricus bisporus var. bisporus H97]|uniref:hypothetical protein n=1 Tax=Agaricus bisporus var. bisporus (strain H97 / ATCC MYA-4626 / FGSC 10389) TaxID=936046 RepID=UPI00029F4EE7|nr:hypothetical protein AGABI2DRAFT_116080 [Agaricus bisporus var. bisporus H97]EKV49042.1 hypothetical protein AGABI2DRAFT_116080 [Agaricus bisporus var. bisporus H97]